MTDFTRNSSQDFNVETNDYFSYNGEQVITEDTTLDIQLESKYKQLNLIVEPEEASVYIYDFDDANDIQIEGYNSITFDITPSEAIVEVRDSKNDFFELTKKTIFIPNNTSIYYQVSCSGYDTISSWVGVYQYEKNKHITISLTESDDWGWIEPL